MYLFGALGTAGMYCIECTWARHGHWTIEDMPHMLCLVEEVIFVFVFSCINEVVNYLLLLYFIKKTLVTKASVFGIVGSIFIIFVSIFSGKIQSVLLWAEILVFLTGYVIIYLTKKREKLRKKKNVVKYYEEQSEDELAKVIANYDRVHVFKEHFAHSEAEAAWKFEEFNAKYLTLK